MSLWVAKWGDKGHNPISSLGARTAVLFIGTSEHTIDPKQRLAVPAKYRSQWDTNKDGTAWVAIPWPGGVIRLYTEATFERLAAAEERTLTPGRGQADFEAGFFGFAERLEMDSTGRITLPKRHVELTGLSGNVVIIGAGNRLEVRPRDQWLAEVPGRFALMDTQAEQVEAKRRANGSLPLSNGGNGGSYGVGF